MIGHAAFEVLAVASLDFELSESERMELDRHLAECADCRLVLERYRRDAAYLRTLAFADPPDRVHDALVRAAEGRLPRRPAWQLLVAAVLAVALLAAAAIGVGTVIRQLLERPQIVAVVPPSLPPTVDGSASPAPSTSGPVASQPPAGGWETVSVPIDGVTGVRLPAGSVRSVPASGEAGLGIVAVVGPRVYSVEAGALWLLDLSSGTSAPIDLPVAGGEELGPVAANDAWIVALVERRTGEPGHGGEPCSGRDASPVDWRVVAAPLGGNGLPAAGFAVVDSGTNERPFRPGGSNFIWCDGPLAPALSLAADRVAYTREAADAERADGSDIVVRSLADGAVVRTIELESRVLALGSSPKVLAWWEAANALRAGVEAPWELGRADAATGLVERAEITVSVDPDSRAVAVDGRMVIAAGAAGAAGPPGRILRWDTGSPQDITPLDTDGQPRQCRLVSAAGGRVAMACSVPYWLDQGNVEVNLVWSAGTGPWVVADLIDGGQAVGARRLFDRAWLGDGWLVWGGESFDGSTWTSEIAGVPLGGDQPAP